MTEQELTPLEKRPVGRPKLPENIIKELQQKIIDLEAENKKQTDASNFEELKQLAEIIRIVQRAVKGLDPNEDVFQGLIDVKDIRERTRLDEAALLSHSAMKIAAEKWPEFNLFNSIAEEEDHYFISEDGEGRKEGILLQQAKTRSENSLTLNQVNTKPETETEQNGQPPKKKSGLFSKIPFIGRH